MVICPLLCFPLLEILASSYQVKQVQMSINTAGTWPELNIGHGRQELECIMGITGYFSCYVGFSLGTFPRLGVLYAVSGDINCSVIQLYEGALLQSLFTWNVFQLIVTKQQNKQSHRKLHTAATVGSASLTRLALKEDNCGDPGPYHWWFDDYIQSL